MHSGRHCEDRVGAAEGIVGGVGTGCKVGCGCAGYNVGLDTGRNVGEITGVDKYGACVGKVVGGGGQTFKFLL
jgi:hypothetical protein